MTRLHWNNTIGVHLSTIKSARGQRGPAVQDALGKETEDTERMLYDYLDNAGWEAKRIFAEMDQAEHFYMSGAGQVKHLIWTNRRAFVIGNAGFATFGI